MAMAHKIWILSLFPDYFSPLLQYGVTASAFRGERGEKFDFHFISLKDYSQTKYKNIDDATFGGGPGMVIKADLLKLALMEGVFKAGGYTDLKKELHVVYPSPRGKIWNNQMAKCYADDYILSAMKDLVFICGRYEGIDERFLENYVDEEISLGDYVLSGGELAVMTILDSLVRFVPGALGNQASATEDSFENSLLDHPHYTRPLEFEGKQVPPILLSGHHAKIHEYRLSERVRLTKYFRPDLFDVYSNKGKK